MRPHDTDVLYVLGKLGELKGDEREVDLTSVFRNYISNDDRSSYNILRFPRDARIFGLIREELRSSPHPLIAKKVLHLMHGFENRRHSDVVRVVVDHWRMFSDADYDMAVDAMTAYPIVPESLKTCAIECLQADLGTERREMATQGMDRLLGQ